MTFQAFYGDLLEVAYLIKLLFYRTVSLNDLAGLTTNLL
jgi:hypothetical protein